MSKIALDVFSCFFSGCCQNLFGMSFSAKTVFRSWVWGKLELLWDVQALGLAGFSGIGICSLLGWQAGSW